MSARDRLFPVAADGVHVLPVLHDRLESAELVRRAFLALSPDAVAVEVPSSLGRTWLRAVDRLPSISVLLYETARDETIYLPVHPADPMAEAARAAREASLPLACADLDVDGYADHRDPAPDSYTMIRLGPAAIFDAYRTVRREADPLDARRESSMAWHARQLRSEGAERVLLVCGMHHVEGIAAALARPQGIPLSPPERRNVRLVHLHPESLGEVLGEIPFYVAAYEARRRGVPPEPEVAEPETAGRRVGPFRVLSGGGGDDPGRLARAVARVARRSGWDDWRRWAGGDEPRPTAPEGQPGPPGPLDRLRLQWALLREAEGALRSVAPDERVERWQRLRLAKYARNLARISGGVVADLFDLVVASRGCVSENFAWEVLRLATSYPAQAGTAADLPTARIRAEELFDGVRRVRVTRRLRREKTRRPERLLRRRRFDEAAPGEWLSGFDDDRICSYPPEDAVVEAFGGYLRKRGKSVLSEENARTVPFTTSVLDGIDVRETIRHWAERRLYVREKGRAAGEVASVVVIFDEDSDPEAERFPYRLTWLGEHQQESDMAFYATPPAEAIVGPGICRVTYGGFLLSYPPGRLGDVWTDPEYGFAESKPEVLLLAALDYSRDRVIVHAGSRPPRSIFHSIAARLDRRILHLPLGTISPATVRKLRVMHVLSGHDKRAIAKDFVW